MTIYFDTSPHLVFWLAHHAYSDFMLSSSIGVLPPLASLASFPVSTGLPPLPTVSPFPPWTCPTSSLGLPFTTSSPYGSPPVTSSVTPILPPAQMGLILSPAANPISHSLVQRIRSGQFVEMQDILADNISLLGQLSAVNNTWAVGPD